MGNQALRFPVGNIQFGLIRFKFARQNSLIIQRPGGVLLKTMFTQIPRTFIGNDPKKPGSGIFYIRQLIPVKPKPQQRFL